MSINKDLVAASSTPLVLAILAEVDSYGYAILKRVRELSVLLVNLVGSALLYARFLRGGIAFSRLSVWQTTYLFFLAGWAAVVAFLFPLLFGFR